MKFTLPALLGVFAPAVLLAQNLQTARLKQALSQATTDSVRTLLMAEVSMSYSYSLPDSALVYSKKGAFLARQIRFPRGEIRCLRQSGLVLSEKGDLAGSLRELSHAEALSNFTNNQQELATTLQVIGALYVSFPNYKEAKEHLFRAKVIYDNQQKVQPGVSRSIESAEVVSLLANLGYAYRSENQLDSARYYQQLAYQLAVRMSKSRQNALGDPLPFILRELGVIESKEGHTAIAVRYLHQSATAALADNNQQIFTRASNSLATVFQEQKRLDSAIIFARQALNAAQRSGLTIGILKNSQLLAQLFKANRQTDSALRYTELMITANDSLYNQQRIKQLEAISVAEQQGRRRAENERALFESKVQLYALLSGVIVLLILSVILWRNNRQHRQSNAQLQLLNGQINEQKEELTTQRDDLTKTLSDLRTTQMQLIQAEKMASLGELTAGIAHEIQNPLNFVNNFSEVSIELVDEIRQELDHEPLDKPMVREILSDLAQNQAKIAQHGSRASSIVKGMLEHSRTNTGERQVTDLNALVDEYLRLAYHGLRAKNKAFNCELVTDFDSNLPRLGLVPQDIGRVLLNLFNNAFYAVSEKKKQAQGPYQPIVSVSTKRKGDKVVICVRDNGTGIPDSVKAKIFQPFFTTKPSGQGTGLGLSLSYDIVTQGHSGTLTVESHLGEGSEFDITLPA